MAALDILARLARQATDQSKGALREINQAIAAIEQRIESLGIAAGKEAADATDFMTFGATLPAYLRANKQQIENTLEQLRKLQAKREDQIDRLRREQVELKRYELLVERRDSRIVKERAAKEQKRLDDLIATKVGRSNKK